MKEVTLTFRKGNKIPYGQDHRFHRGLPHGVSFRARRLANARLVVLDAPGYGELGGDHGNGALYAYGRWINRRFKLAQGAHQ